MIGQLLLPFLLQSVGAPQEPYVPEVSQDVRAVLSDVAAEGDRMARLEALADGGDDSALELLGEAYSLGLFGVERDPARACTLFERLGERRPDGLHNRATCRYEGRGMARDLPQARALYRKAAEAGWLQAVCAYGNMLVRGEGGPADPREGVRLCASAAAAGDANAQTDYGTYLLTGQGVARDPVAARFVLEEAAGQDQPNATFLLGQVHAKGDGVPMDHAAARRWFEKAHALGRRDAAYQVAMQFVAQGYGEAEGGQTRVAPDLLQQAIEWLRIAEAQDYSLERREQAAQLIPNLETLIAAARKAD